MQTLATDFQKGEDEWDSRFTEKRSGGGEGRTENSAREKHAIRGNQTP